MASDILNTSITEYPYEFERQFAYGPLNAAEYFNTSCSQQKNQSYPKCSSNLPVKDFQYEMNLKIGGAEAIVVGEIIQRNGIFFYDNNVQYTPKNPCWENFVNDAFRIYILNVSVKSSFCCLRFNNSFTSTLPATTFEVDMSHSTSISSTNAHTLKSISSTVSSHHQINVTTKTPLNLWFNCCLFITLFLFTFLNMN